MEEAMLDFFYYGINPLIKNSGYKWISDDETIARNFLRFCYNVQWALQSDTRNLNAPEAQHRDLIEDRETFDLFISTSSFVDLLELWSFRKEIVGSRFEHMILDFCYVWVNVQNGKPGNWTKTTLEMSDENYSDEEYDSYLPDTFSKRRTYDLY